jgi:hypothetical protein
MRRKLAMQVAEMDRFFARLNSGMMAVALVLGLVTVVAATVRVQQNSGFVSASQRLTDAVVGQDSGQDWPTANGPPSIRQP